MNVQTQPNIGQQMNSVAPSNNLLVSNKGGVLLSLLGFNSGPNQFIQVHDAAALPADGNIPLYTFLVPANAAFSIDTPLKTQNGIVVCNSSTFATKTIGANDCWFVTRNM